MCIRQWCLKLLLQSQTGEVASTASWLKMVVLLLQLVYSADVVRSNTAEIAEVLIDTVMNPKLNPWEVAEQIFRLKEDLKKFHTNHMGVMQEVPTTHPHLTSPLLLSLDSSAGVLAPENRLDTTPCTCNLN